MEEILEEGGERKGGLRGAVQVEEDVRIVGSERGYLHTWEGRSRFALGFFIFYFAEHAKRNRNRF